MTTDRRKKYESKRVLKNVSFNIDNEDDKKRLDFIDKISFSEWVKSKIDEEINRKA